MIVSTGLSERWHGPDTIHLGKMPKNPGYDSKTQTVVNVPSEFREHKAEMCIETVIFFPECSQVLFAPF